LLDIFPRKNSLQRPPLANVDNLVVVASMTIPKPNLRMLDLLLAQAVTLGIQPVVLFTKCDETDQNAGETLAELYRACGYRAYAVSPFVDTGIADLRDLLAK
jgi:ribosome biogenesis GTPase